VNASATDWNGGRFDYNFSNKPVTGLDVGAIKAGLAGYKAFGAVNISES
jgi:hypothetical protein